MALVITTEIKDLIAAAAKAAVAEALVVANATPPTILRIVDVQKRLGVSRTEVYRLIKSRKLTARKQGSMTVFRTDEVDAYVHNLPEAERSACS